MDKILPVYEQTKQAMNFDPEGMALVFGPPENWNLHEDHPVDVMTRIREMATELGWTQEQLEQEWAWMSWLFEQERGKGDADEQTQQNAQAEGHPGPGSSVGDSGSGSVDAGASCPAGKDPSDQGGGPQPVRRVRRRKTDPPK